MGAGHTGPLQSPIPKPHQASRAINGCISLSLLSSLSLFICNLIPLGAGDLVRVCVAALAEADSAFSEREGSHMLAV